MLNNPNQLLQRQSHTDLAPPVESVVGIIACNFAVRGYEYSGVVRCYVEAIVRVSQCTPLLIPSIGQKFQSSMAVLDGLLLTGSASNVHPSRYESNVTRIDDNLDEARDRASLQLIEEALKVNLPILAICRGFQELNVALGGTLQTDINKTSKDVRHSADSDRPIEQQYSPAHDVKVINDGFLHELLGKSGSITVNSLHDQGIERIADTLSIEALAPDGLVEAVSSTEHDFVLGVQWHPEWHVASDNASQTIFAAFGDACRHFHTQHANRIRRRHS